MHPFLNQHLEAIRDLCRRHQVRSLYAFGSVVGSEFDPAKSDVDFVVEFEPETSGGFSHPYFTLHEDLEHLLGRKVDLVMVGAIRNPYFAKSVAETKVPLYAAA